VNASVNQPEGENRKLTKSELLNAFKADLKSADTLRQEAISNVDRWKREYNGEAYGNEEKGKSAFVSRDIKRQDEWQHASVKDPFVSNPNIVRCNPVTYEDRAAAEQNELVLNYQFTRKFPRYQFMTDVVKLFYAEGTVIVKTSWDYEDKIVTREFPVYALDPFSKQPVPVNVKTAKVREVLVNQPAAEICRIEDIYIDPTCQGDLSKAQFVIHRYESDLSTLTKAGKYKNLKKVARNLFGEDGDDFESEDDTEFRFSDKARKKVIVYEYWGNFDVNNDGIAEPIVCTWVEDVVIQLQENPFPDKALPFLMAKNNPIPFKVHGEAAAELIGDNQKLATAIKRGIMDNMANSNNGQKGVRQGALDTLNRKRFLNGKNFIFNGNSATDFFEGSYNDIPQSVFQILQMLSAESESMLGVKSFSGGISGQSLGATATSARGALDAVSVRRLDIVRNIAENIIKPMMRKWMAYNAEFLRPEEIIRITNEEFVPIKRDDLKGYVDIEIEVTTAEDNSMKAQELAFLLQTLGQNMDPNMQKLLMGQIAKLNKMPDLAKQIEEFEPQPDPYMQRMKELELKKMVSEIMERMSRTVENETDVRAKNAKAGLDEAKTRELNSTTDLKDLEFTRKADGLDFDEEMTMKQHDRETSLAKQGMVESTKRRSSNAP
jgi:hypothetical protein